MDSGDWDRGTGRFVADFDYLKFSVNTTAQSRLEVNGRLAMEAAQLGQTGFEGKGTLAGLTSRLTRDGVKASSLTVDSGTITVGAQNTTASSMFDQRVCGTMNSPSLPLRVASLVPIEFNSSSLFPVSGVVVAEGTADNVKLTYVQGDNVTVDVDLDGDGRPEGSQITTVSGLLDGQ